MKIFLTGASGYVGRHIAEELLARAHEVIGLARKPSPRTARLNEVEWLFADLEQFEELSDTIEGCDGVIHCAMNYSNSGIENSALDGSFIGQIESSEKFFIYTGNLYSSRPDPDEPFLEDVLIGASDWRFQNEIAVLDSIAAAAVVRLGFVYGGGGGTLWDMFPPGAIAGFNVDTIKPAYWPMIHVRDVATLYATIAEQQLTGVFHAFDGHVVTAREIVAKLKDIYPPATETGEDFHGHIYDLLEKSVKTKNARSLSTGWKPAFDTFLNNAAQAYSQYRSSR